MRRGREVRAQGFTLVELMIVIAIIAILASIAIPQYLKYQRKAKVSSYVMPTTRACAMDIVTFCVENPGSSDINVNKTNTPNCSNGTAYTNYIQQETAGGNVTVGSPLNKFSCNDDGSLNVNDDTEISFGNLTNVGDYKAVCKYKKQSIHCSIVGQ